MYTLYDTIEVSFIYIYCLVHTTRFYLALVFFYKIRDFSSPFFGLWLARKHKKRGPFSLASVMKSYESKKVSKLSSLTFWQALRCDGGSVTGVSSISTISSISVLSTAA